MARNEYVNQGALWNKTTKQGKPFLSGNFELPDGTVLQVSIFPNEHKKTDKHPDYVVYVKQSDFEAVANVPDQPF